MNTDQKIPKTDTFQAVQITQKITNLEYWANWPTRFRNKQSDNKQSNLARQKPN